MNYRFDTVMRRAITLSHEHDLQQMERADRENLIATIIGVLLVGICVWSLFNV